MTAKKTEEEKQHHSLGQKRKLARDRASETTYTDDETGKHYIGGFEVSAAMWETFLVENPEFGGAEAVEAAEETIAEVVETDDIDVVTPAPETVGVDVEETVTVEVTPPPQVDGHSPDAHGAQTMRHFHPELGRKADPGLWHAHVRGGYPHEHEKGYGDVMDDLARDWPVKEEKTEEQKDSEHAQAMKAAQEADREAKVTFPEVGDAEGDILLWVVVDGFTALGKVWFMGEEILIQRGSTNWELTLDREGRSWAEMGEEEQTLRYGKVMFRPGPWPGKKGPMTEDEYDRALTDHDRAAIERYEKQQQSLGIPMVRAGSSRAGSRKW